MRRLERRLANLERLPGEKGGPLRILLSCEGGPLMDTSGRIVDLEEAQRDPGTVCIYWGLSEAELQERRHDNN